MIKTVIFNVSGSINFNLCIKHVHGLPKPVEIGEFGLQLDHSNI